MKTLYFDIDGTILRDDDGAVKAALCGGRFEEAARAAGFESLVCVGNFGAVVRQMRENGIPYDDLGVIHALCRDAFLGDGWLRSVATIDTDPEHRADHIDYSGDWWYVDDRAEHYMEQAGRDETYAVNIGGRILVPEARGDGGDVVAWLMGGAFRGKRCADRDIV